MSSMTCPKCDGEIEYDVERADSGDGPWAQSYWVGYVQATEDETVPPAGFRYVTACGCHWTEEQIAQLDDRASELACEVSEP